MAKSKFYLVNLYRTDVVATTVRVRASGRRAARERALMFAAEAYDGDKGEMGTDWDYHHGTAARVTGKVVEDGEAE